MGKNFILTSHVQKPTGLFSHYHWQLEDSAGTVLGETETMMSYSPFSISGNVLIYIRPAFSTYEEGQENYRERSIQAVDLSSGEVIWTRAIRDTRYHGPYPV